MVHKKFCRSESVKTPWQAKGFKGRKKEKTAKQLLVPVIIDRIKSMAKRNRTWSCKACPIDFERMNAGVEMPPITEQDLVELGLFLDSDGILSGSGFCKKKSNQTISGHRPSCLGTRRCTTKMLVSTVRGLAIPKMGHVCFGPSAQYCKQRCLPGQTMRTLSD